MVATASPVRAEVAVVRLARPDGPAISSATRFVIAADEQAFIGHYPGLPLFPGVCVVECAHRSSLATAPDLATGVPLRLTGVRSARFRRPVFPGDELSVRIDWSPAPTGWTCDAGISSDRGEVARTALCYRSGPGTDPSVPAAAGVEPVLMAPMVTPAEIQRLMPHRYPMLLIDRVKDIVPGQRIVAVKAISYTDIWYAHRPPDATAEQLAFPAALVVESWLQAAGVLVTWQRPNPDPLAGEVMLLGGLTNIRFVRAIVPGDLLEHRVRLLREDTDAMIFEGECVVDGTVAMTVERVSMALRSPESVVRS